MGFLDKVELAFECPLAWDKLVGGDRERFCGACDKHVTNLSAMTRGEAASFLRTSPGPICVRVEVDATSGRALHRPTLRVGALSLSLVASPVDGCMDKAVEGVVDAPTSVEMLGERVPVMGVRMPEMMGEPMVAAAAVEEAVEAVEVEAVDAPPIVPEATEPEPSEDSHVIMGGIRPGPHARMGKIKRP